MYTPYILVARVCASRCAMRYVDAFGARAAPSMLVHVCERATVQRNQ